MRPRWSALASLAGAELSEFLYAPIGSENNGMTLSVHSALTRLNRDQLCEFPKHAAAVGLCSLSGRLPAFSWAHAGCLAIAEHLIEFLPDRGSPLRDVPGVTADQPRRCLDHNSCCLGLAAIPSCEPSRADGINQGQSFFQTWHGQLRTLMAQKNSAPQ